MTDAAHNQHSETRRPSDRDRIETTGPSRFQPARPAGGVKTAGRSRYLQRPRSRLGGVGGTKWMAPLLPKDFPPPVDLRWPEYIQTARGEEWWIPTPATGSGAGEPL